MNIVKNFGSSLLVPPPSAFDTNDQTRCNKIEKRIPKKKIEKRNIVQWREKMLHPSKQVFSCSHSCLLYGVL